MVLDRYFLEEDNPEEDEPKICDFCQESIVEGQRFIESKDSDGNDHAAHTSCIDDWFEHQAKYGIVIDRKEDDSPMQCAICGKGILIGMSYCRSGSAITPTTPFYHYVCMLQEE